MINSPDIDVFARLASHVAASALDAGNWQTLTDQLAQHFDGAAFQLIGFDANGGETGFLTTGYDPDMIDSYAQYYAGQNAWAPGFVARNVGEVVPAQIMCPDDDLMRTEFYNDWVKPQDDISLGGGAIIDCGPGGTFVIGGNTPRRLGDDMAEAWLSTLGLLIPQLRTSWRIAKAMTATHLTGGWSAPNLLVEGSGRIVFANDAGADMLERGYPLGQVGGRLHGLGEARVERWLACVKALFLRGGLDAPPELVLPEWTLRASFLSVDHLADSVPRALLGVAGPVMCFVAEPGRVTPDRAEQLAQAYGLTRSEAEVTVLLADGAEPRKIAETREVSIHTIRNQIKSAMFKCGVSRQTQLVALAVRL